MYKYSFTLSFASFIHPCSGLSRQIGCDFSCLNSCLKCCLFRLLFQSTYLLYTEYHKEHKYHMYAILSFCLVYVERLFESDGTSRRGFKNVFLTVFFFFNSCDNTRYHYCSDRGDHVFVCLFIECCPSPMFRSDLDSNCAFVREVMLRW